MFDGAERAAVAEPGAESLVLGLEVGVLGAGRGEGGFFERDPEPFGAFAGPAGAAFAGGLVVAGAASGPGGEVPGGREHGHVDADLGDDAPRRCGAATPGIVHSSSTAGRERAELLLDRVGEPVDLLVEEVEVGEDRADHQRVMGVEAALQRLAQRRELRAQPALGEVGEHLGVGRARNERVEHRPAGLAEDVGGDAVELDAGVLERLVQPVGLALALRDLRLAIPRQVPQLRAAAWAARSSPRNSPASISWQSHCASETSVLRPGTCLTCRALHERQLEVVLQDVPDRLPIHAGRLHRDVRHADTPPASHATPAAPRPSSRTPPHAAHGTRSRQGLSRRRLTS